MISGLRPVLLLPLLVLAIVPFIFFGVVSGRILESYLLPELEAQTINAAVGVQRRVDHAIKVFDGLHTLREVEVVLDNVRSSTAGMSFLVLTGPEGDIRHLSAGNPETARVTLATAAEPASQEITDILSDLWQKITGKPLFSPTIMTSRRIGDLLVTQLPLGGGLEHPVGFLYAGVDVGLLDALNRDMWFDIATVVLATVLVALELMILIFTVLILRPAWMVDFLTARLAARDLRFTLRPRQSAGMQALVWQIDGIITRVIAVAKSRSIDLLGHRLPGPEGPRTLRAPAVSYIRVPLFLFFLSEAILRPVLPQFLGQFAPLGSNPEFHIGLIMSAFMGASIASVLIGSILAEKKSPRQVFLWGAIFTCAGLIGHLYSSNLTMILLMRALTGFGYGLVYAAAQVHIAQHASRQRRSSGFSLFLSVIVAAEISGPAMGGVLADQLGVVSVLLVATFSAGISALTCLLLLSRQPPHMTDADKSPTETSGSDVLRIPGWFPRQWFILRKIMNNPRFMVIIVCFALPAKALLTGGLFLLVPLAVNSSAAESARVLMGYGIPILLLAPLLAPLADRWRGFGFWVAAGGVIASVGFILPHAMSDITGDGLAILFAATLLLGLGQCLSIPTQISFLMQVSDRQIIKFGAGTVLGIFRFLERLGSLLGPLVAGSLLLIFTPKIAMMWMGLGAVLLATCGLSWFLAFGEEEERVVIHDLLIKT